MYTEVFYWIYYYLKKIKTNDMPAFNSLLILTFIQTFNFGSFAIIFNYLFNIEMTNKRQDIFIWSITWGVFLIIIDYIFIFSKREIIIKKYDSISESRKNKGIAFFWLYFLFSIILFFSLGINLVETVK